MAKDKLVVCERGDRLILGLRRALVDTPVAFVQTRSVAEAFQSLKATPAALFVLELNVQSLDPALELLAVLRRADPLTRVIVALQEDTAEYEPLVRELGATHVLTSPADWTGVAEIVARHYEQRRRLQPQLPTESITEKIVADLPWGD